MTRDWSLVIFGLLLVAACAVIGARPIQGLTLGSVGEWIGGIGTVGALFVAIYLARSDARRARQRDEVVLVAAALTLAGPVTVAQAVAKKIGEGQDHRLVSDHALDFCTRHQFFEKVAAFDPSSLPSATTMTAMISAQLGAQTLHNELVAAQAGGGSLALIDQAIRDILRQVEIFGDHWPDAPRSTVSPTDW